MALPDMIESITKNTARLDEGLNKFSAVQSLILGEDLSEEQVSSLREFQCIDDYLELPLNDPKEGGLKKVFASIIAAAESLDILPFDLPDNSAEAIASIADECLNRIKVAYEIATNRLDLEEASEAIADHEAARTMSVVDFVIDQATDCLADQLADVLSAAMISACPPTAVLAPVIKIGMKFVSKKTRNSIRKQMPRIKEAAKPVVQKALGKSRLFAKSMGSKLSRWLFE